MHYNNLLKIDLVIYMYIQDSNCTDLIAALQLTHPGVLPPDLCSFPRPCSWHTTLASELDQDESHTRPHRLLYSTSTRSKLNEGMSTRRELPSGHAARLGIE